MSELTRLGDATAWPPAFDMRELTRTFTDDEVGPPLLDFATIRAFAERVQSGIIALTEEPAEWTGWVQSLPRSEFDDVYAKAFQDQLVEARANPEQVSPFVLDLRVRALVEAVESIIAAVRGVQRSEGKAEGVKIDPAELEERVAILAGALEAKLGTDRALAFAESAANLTPDELATLLSVDKGVLQQWRFKGVGPEFFSLGSRRAGVRYPVAGVLAWMIARTEATDPTGP